MTERLKYLKIGSFIAIIMAIIILLSVAVRPLETNAGKGKFDKVVTQVNMEQENTIDVVVLGDSEAYRSISPLEIYQGTGITTFVSASPAQTSFQAYEMLQTVLERQNPKLCIVEINLLYRTYSAAAAVVPKLERMLPIFKYHNMWKELADPSYSFENVSAANYKGYRYVDAIHASTNPNYMKETEEKARISMKNNTYVTKIIELCRENDIEILFLRTPSTKNWNYAKHNGTKAFAEENDVPFIDLNIDNEVKIDWNKDTPDRGDHLNYYGAHKVTKYLKTYLTDNYNLPDHRKDAGYEDWNEALKVYKKNVS